MNFGRMKRILVTTMNGLVLVEPFTDHSEHFHNTCHRTPIHTPSDNGVKCPALGRIDIGAGDGTTEPLIGDAVASILIS